MKQIAFVGLILMAAIFACASVYAGQNNHTISGCFYVLTFFVWAMAAVIHYNRSVKNNVLLAQRSFYTDNHCFYAVGTVTENNGFLQGNFHVYILNINGQSGSKITDNRFMLINVNHIIKATNEN